MKALIVHYHLKPGGVTTVIRRQVSALAGRGIEAVVLSGEAPGHGFPGTVIVEPALAYDTAREDPLHHGPTAHQVRSIVKAIQREADALGDRTVIHVHNPIIRKNSSLLGAIGELASSGCRLLLHIHDLAEDWRPDAYPHAAYPDGVSWAVINRHDARQLAAAGAGSVFFLPNPVPTPFRGKPGGEEADRGALDGMPGLVLYPVRGIRRKNLGEAVLLSLYARTGASIGVTLPPNGMRDMPCYDSWRGIASKLDAPVRFGLGLERELDALYTESRAIVTTSIKEGFGLAYLESASRDRAIFGRRLPRVVADFEDEGLSFPGLYKRLAVTPALFDEDAFRVRIRRVVEATAAAFGRREAGPALAEMISEGLLTESDDGPDYGRLDEKAQTEVLESIASDHAVKARFLGANPWLETWDARSASLPRLSAAALAPWSGAAYGERLQSAYQQVLESGGGPAPRKDALLDAYLVPETFHGVGVQSVS
jgi:glycosyltransferase involved in cell wall biosynthesis